MSASVKIVVGPARSGKTAMLLDRYRQVLRDNQHRATPGANLWLTPTSRSRRAVLELLPDTSLRILFAPNVFTFDQFAERILGFSQQNLRPLSEASRRLVMSSIIHQLNSAGKLRYFGHVAETAGFIDLASSLISELKRNETWPEHFREACEARGASDKDRELALIYETYQATLNAHALYDAEGRFWSARSAISQGHREPFRNLSLVVVDGFADFTRTQYEILGHLANWSTELLVSLPQESNAVDQRRRRIDLFSKSTEAVTLIEQAVGRNVERIEAESRRCGEDLAVDTIADSLFVNPRATAPTNGALGLEILGVVGQRGEVRAIAERIKQLLLNGTLPGDIVLAIRRLEDYADLVKEVFSDAGIPFACAPQGRLAQAPPIKALLGVLKMELDNWSFGSVKATLLSNYFQTDEDSPETFLRRVRVVSSLRRLGVAEGREAILQGLASAIERAERSSTQADSDAESNRGTGETAHDATSDVDLRRREVQQARLAADALPVVERLSQHTDLLRSQATFAEWADRVTRLAADLGMTRENSLATIASDENLADRDALAWDEFRNVLFSASRTLDLLKLDGEKLDLASFYRRLTDVLANHGLPSRPDPPGCVPVVDAAEVRNLEIPYLFLAGLTEGSFPSSRRDDCLYSEADRLRLNESGLGMRNRATHSHDEMMLFYQVVTRARRRLVLSYPSVSATGQPLFPSPYVAAVRELFNPESLPVEQIGQLDSVPDSSEMLSHCDLRLVATDAVRDKRPGLFRTLAELPESQPAALNILASVDAAVARFHTRGFTRYEGELSSTPVRDRCAVRFPHAYEFSATQLERYAGCGFRFFVSDVLGIEPLESLETQTDYLARGVMVHDILAQIHHLEASRSTSERVDPLSIVDRFRELVDLALRPRTRRSELREALDQIERDLLHDWAEAYGEQWTRYSQKFAEKWSNGPRPAYLEIPFGNVPGSAPNPVKTGLPALVFGTGENEARVRGRIDRIDVGYYDGKPVFNVIDYKTGHPPNFGADDVANGRALQLALYTVAVLRHELAGREATPYQLGYWSLRESGFVSGIKREGRNADQVNPQLIETLLLSLETIVPQLAQGIRSGKYLVDSLDSECTGRCPYRTVCRVNQVRPLAESLGKARASTTIAAPPVESEFEDT